MTRLIAVVPQGNDGGIIGHQQKRRVWMEYQMERLPPAVIEYGHLLRGTSAGGVHEPARERGGAFHVHGAALV
jgi:hypothetical protein